MTSTKLSPNDRKDLEKYTKHFALKFTQVIVQSRLGEKLRTPSKSQTGDWFSLAIQDHPNVQAEAKRFLCPKTGRACLPMCVEISLRTAEGEAMTLEAWSLSNVADASEPEVHGKFAVYNRMGKLLKSLMSVTRAMPAYRLSRLQCPPSYIIYYRVYCGEADTAGLGEGQRSLRVGQLATAVGGLAAAVAYRTKMTITPAQARGSSLLVHSHHFREPQVDLDRPLRAGAFVDEARARRYTEEDFVLPEQPAFSWLLEAPPSPASPDASAPRPAASPPPLDSAGPDSDKKEDPLMKELHFPFAIADKCPTGILREFYRDFHGAQPLQSFADHLESALPDISRQLEEYEASVPEYDIMINSLCHSPNNN